MTSLVLALAFIQPFRAFPVGFDTASSVVYFQRLIAGQRLETFLGTTPKPLLTVIDGLLFAVASDWRVIGLVAVAAYAASIAATTALAGRVTGSAVGAAFVGGGLTALSLLLLDAATAYAYSWMLLSVAVAGLALLRAKPRFAFAGLALCVGTLARQEVLFVTGIGAVTYAIAALRARGRDGVSENWAWTIGIALLAVPVQALHDWLLTGDVGYVFRVQELGATGRAVPGLIGTLDIIGIHFESMWVLIALAVGGLAIAARRRAWPIVVALIAFGPTTFAFVLVVGWRNLLVLERYLTPIDLAIVFGGAIAVSYGWTSFRSALARRTATQSALVGGQSMGIVAAVAAAVVLSRPIGVRDTSLISQVGRERRAAEDLAMLAPALHRTIDALPDLRILPESRHPDAYAWWVDLDRLKLIVPARVLPVVIAEFGITAARVATIGNPMFGTTGVFPKPGWLVLHLGSLPDEASRYTFLEVERRTVVGSITLDPIAAVDGHGWLIEIDRAP